tara:strand:+ start:325 stop:1023 length:699 start_codon:yes stop_codon:yes gene_type:complete
VSDFERTFGAGANLDSIIGEFSRTPNDSGYDASEIIFYNYSDALEFIRKDTGLILRVSSETYEDHKLIFDACLDKKPPEVITRDIYKVSCLREGEYIRVTDYMQEEYHFKAIAQVFTLTVPYDPDEAARLRYYLPTGFLQIIEGNEITPELIFGYFNKMGNSQWRTLTRKPRDLDEIVMLFKSSDMKLIPISETISVICFYEQGVDAALVTKDDCTYLVQKGFSDGIYNMLI